MKRWTTSRENAKVGESSLSRSPPPPQPPASSSVAPVLSIIIPVNQQPIQVLPGQNVPPGAYLRKPMDIICPYCRKYITTKMRTKPNIKTFFFSLGFFFCCICLTCAPYFIRSMNTCKHKCPNCKKTIGRAV
ncbi:hypothetical protein SNEBB_004208 [Seison nebaliae]|nr:hypothetical protein SNEBB_004208 [Seison nebaliae]